MPSESPRPSAPEAGAPTPAAPPKRDAPSSQKPLAPPAPDSQLDVSEAGMNDHSIPAESQRIYIDAAVNFRAEGGRSATGFVRDLSMTGMFIGTDTLYLTGTEVDFSIRAGSGVIEGSGRVVWQRAAPSSQNLPIGIGVSFDRLDPDSRLLVRHLVDGSEHPRPSADKVEDLRDAVSAGLDAGSSWRPVEGLTRDTLDRPAVYRAERGRPRKKIGMTAWSLLALVALFGVGLVLQNLLTVKSPAAAPRPLDQGRASAADDSASRGTSEEPNIAAGGMDAAAQTSDSPPADGAGGPESASVLTEHVAASQEVLPENPTLATARAAETGSAKSLPSATVSPPEDSTTVVQEATFEPERAETAIRSWAAAWASQDATKYIDAYVDGYSTGGLSSAAWQEQRQQRLTNPSVIEVEVEDLAVRPVGAGAEATFVQRYRSDSYRDVVRKTLSLVQEDGQWKIRAEASEPAP